MEPYSGANSLRVLQSRLTESVLTEADLVKERQKYPGFYQSAYHGSPHLFDFFSTDFIGSGEGAQAHGWGVYFAQSKQLAENYRRILAGKKFIDEFEEK